MPLLNPLYVILTVAVVGLIPLAWGLRCNQRTYTQRRQLIDLISARDDWQPLQRAFANTGYETHVWALIFFRDPWKEYHPMLQRLVRDGK